MQLLMKDRISIYTKGGVRAATSYYRIYQYLQDFGGDYKFKYNTMISDDLYKRFMPIAYQNIFIKIYFFIYIFIRVLFQLIEDTYNRPKILIVSRRFINKFFPIIYKILLNKIKKNGTLIIWDFDDNIIASKELTRKGFDYMSCISNYIIIASKHNLNLIKSQYHNKTLYLPTTDGDMYNKMNNSIQEKRLINLKKEIRLIWVGTAGGLQFLRKIIKHLDSTSLEIKKIDNRNTILTIICDKPLKNIDTNNLIIRNIEWERDIAIEEMLRSHIGLMPLEDTVFTRGKGGFKLIQYLSVGLPVIGSPVGINSEILTNDVGMSVEDLDSENWAHAIKEVAMDLNIWNKYSNCAYKKWNEYYSFESNLLVWKSLIN